VSKNGQWTEIGPEILKWKKGILAKALVRGRNEEIGSVPGSHSPTALHNPIKILLVTQSGTPPADYALVQLHDKKDEREFKIEDNHRSGRDVMSVAFNRVGDHSFQVELMQGAGEYGFVAPTSNVPNGALIYTFRILEQ
jgi:hypothetical protein